MYLIDTKTLCEHIHEHMDTHIQSTVLAHPISNRYLHKLVRPHMATHART